jgi:hypothetical protein
MKAPCHRLRRHTMALLNAIHHRTALTGCKTARYTKALSVRKQEPGFRKNRGWTALVC